MLKVLRRVLTKLNVVSFVVDDIGVGEDGHILELGLSDGGAVVRNDQELALSISESLHGKFVPYKQVTSIISCCLNINQDGEK